MKVTVKDCLDLAVFENAKVAAGRKNLRASVKKATVLEARSGEDVKACCRDNNQLLLTSFFAVSEDTKAQCEIIRQAAEEGAAALVLFPVGKTAKGPSREVIDTAEEKSLPLIVMAPGTNADYGDVIGEITGLIFYGDDFENHLISNTIFHLLNFEKHSSFEAAAREAAINNDFQLILLSEDFNPVLSVETRHKTTIAEAIRLGKERDVEKNSTVYTMIDVNGVLTYWGPVTVNNEKYFMFIVDNEDSYSAGEITKLAEIIELAMGMWKYTPERDIKAELIKALRRGNMSLAYTLKNEAGIQDQDILSIFFAKGIETASGLKSISQFETEHGLQVMKITEDEETSGIILGDSSSLKDGEEIEKFICHRLFNKLKEDKSVRIFHVTGVDGIVGAGDAYRLISETWSFVQGVFPYKRVFSKYELVLVSNCINLQLQGGHVKKNYMDLLEPFDDAGGTKGKQLLETLETVVLDAGMNSSKTAEFMGIHTNTVQYRLKKINDVLGVEITGNRVIPGLTIALALKRLERVVS